MDDPLYEVIAIHRKKGPHDRFRVEFTPAREPLDLSGAVLARSRLAARDRLTADRIAAIQRDEDHHRCLERAWSLLSRRKRGRTELIRTLQRRGAPADIAEAVVARLQQMRYIDDLEFARYWVLDRLQRGRHGPERVRRELAAKGIARDIIDQALAPLRDPEGQRERARILLEKWARTHRQPDPRKRRASAAAYLLRRGFEADVAWGVVRERLDNGGDE